MCFLWLAGCSALINVNDTQCNTSSECVKAKLGDRCVQHVCVESHATSDPDAGSSDLPADGKCENDKQCGSASDTPRCMNGDCVTAELADRWLCEETVLPNESGTVKYSFDVIDFVEGENGKRPANIVALACRNNDVSCSDPLGRVTPPAGEGLVQFDLPKGFLGFFDVKADGETPALSYLTKPVIEDMMDRPLQMATPDLVTALASIEGVAFEPATKGIALVEAFDCTGTPAGGVQFKESKGGATPFFLVNHIPNKDANVSVYDKAANVADGGFLNVQAGFVEFAAHWGIDGPELGSFNAHVRAGTITYLDMYF